MSARGGEGKERFQQSASTHSGGRKKRRPSVNSCGKNVGGEDLNPRSIVKSRLPENQHLLKRNYVEMKEHITTIITCSWARDGGGSKKTVPAISVDTLRCGRNGDPQHKVVGTAVGGEYLTHRCVVKVGFQKTSL